MEKNAIDYIPFKGKLEILRYNTDKSKLLHSPYVDDNVIVNVGRQFARGMFADSSKWTNFPTIGASWGDLQPVSNSDLFIDKMKLGMSSVAASPADETLVRPIGGNEQLETGWVGDGVTTDFSGAPHTTGFLPIRRTVTITTWVIPVVGQTTYIYASDDGNGNISGQKDYYDTVGAAWITITVTASIDYSTGIISNLVFSHAPVNGMNIDVFYQTSVSVNPPAHTGGAVYNHTFATVPISPNSLHIQAPGGAVTGYAHDLGNGQIVGNFPVPGVAVTGSINYTTGVMVLNFSAAVPPGTIFTCSYQVDWSRSVDVYFPSPYSTRFEVELAAGEFVDYALAEEAIYTDNTFDLPLARKAFTPFRKAAGEVVVFRHTIIL